MDAKARFQSITYTEIPIVRTRTLQSGACVELKLNDISARFGSEPSSKDRIVDNAGMLQTLAVFYDEILLPYPYGFDPSGPVFWSYPALAKDARHRAMVALMHQEYGKWLEQWKPLFDHGILKTLPPSIASNDEIPSDFSDAVKRKLASNPDGSVNPMALWSGDLALAVHALYANKPSPEFFVSGRVDTSTTRLTGLLATSLFQYEIPKLQELTAEQVLEARECVKDTKEGFLDYLLTLTKDLEQALQSGNQSDVDAARKTVERTIGPAYHQMRRQLSAKKADVFSKVMDRALKIDAPILSPKFWAQTLQAVLGSYADTAEAQTNEGQAFQYVATLDQTVSNLHTRTPDGRLGTIAP